MAHTLSCTHRCTCWLQRIMLVSAGNGNEEVSQALHNFKPQLRPVAALVGKDLRTLSAGDISTLAGRIGNDSSVYGPLSQAAGVSLGVVRRLLADI